MNNEVTLCYNLLSSDHLYAIILNYSLISVLLFTLMFFLGVPLFFMLKVFLFTINNTVT